MSNYTKVQQSSKLIKEFLDAPITPSSLQKGQRNIQNIVGNAGLVAQRIKKILGEKKHKEYLKKRR